MSDFIGDHHCVTHHACDCITEKVRRLELLAEAVMECRRVDGCHGLWDAIAYAEAIEKETDALRAAGYLEDAK